LPQTGITPWQTDLKYTAVCHSQIYSWLWAVAIRRYDYFLRGIPRYDFFLRDNPGYAMICSTHLSAVCQPQPSEIQYPTSHFTSKVRQSPCLMHYLFLTLDL
jgi:hypothetical protein